DLSLVAIGDRTLTLGVPPELGDGQPVSVAIRPENIRLVTSRGPHISDTSDVVPGKVAEVTFLGNLTDCHVTLDDGTRVRIQVDPGETLEVGQQVGLSLDRHATSVFRV